MRDTNLIFTPTVQAVTGASVASTDYVSLTPFFTSGKGFEPGGGIDPIVWHILIIVAPITAVTLEFQLVSFTSHAINAAQSLHASTGEAPVASYAVGRHFQIPVWPPSGEEQIAQGVTNFAIPLNQAQPFLFVAVIGSGGATASLQFHSWLDLGAQANYTSPAVSGMKLFA
jgi:hypothetical protein